MTPEILIVSLSFAIVVGIVSYATNETVKGIQKLLKKRKALNRVSTARHLLKSVPVVPAWPPPEDEPATSRHAGRLTSRLFHRGSHRDATPKTVEQ